MHTSRSSRNPIRTHGVIQPIVVRRVDGDAYEIIAGERRWRAAQQAGLRRVPVVVREVEAEGRQDCSRWPSSRTSSARI